MTDRSLTSTETRFARRQIVYRMTQRATSTTASHFNHSEPLQPATSTDTKSVEYCSPLSFPPLFFLQAHCVSLHRDPQHATSTGTRFFRFPRVFWLFILRFWPSLFFKPIVPRCAATSNEPLPLRPGLLVLFPPLFFAHHTVM